MNPGACCTMFLIANGNKSRWVISATMSRVRKVLLRRNVHRLKVLRIMQWKTRKSAAPKIKPLEQPEIAKRVKFTVVLVVCGPLEVHQPPLILEPRPKQATSAVVLLYRSRQTHLPVRTRHSVHDPGEYMSRTGATCHESESPRRNMSSRRCFPPISRRPESIWPPAKCDASVSWE